MNPAKRGYPGVPMPLLGPAGGARGRCALCDLPVPAAGSLNDGREFCCPACREVYRTFGPTAASTPVAARTGSLPANAREAFFWIDGMHCASCETLIERGAARVAGVLSVDVSYATGTARVVHDPTMIPESALPAALERFGYSVRLRGEPASEGDDRLEFLRLQVGLGLGAVVMMLYLAFFYPVHLSLASASDFAPIAWLAFSAVPAAVALAAGIVVFYVGAPILRGAVAGIRSQMPNMDVLLSLAVLGAFFYSTGQWLNGALDLYFDVAVTIVLVVTLGRGRERRVRREATASLARVLDAVRPRARVIVDGVAEMCAVSELGGGERVRIEQGEMAVVDGVIVSGSGAFSQALITGEPLPSTLGEGDTVQGGSILVEGRVDVTVGDAPRNRMDTLARILWRTQSGTAAVHGIADRMARFFVPLVIVLAALVGGWQYLGGAGPGAALLAALATLIVSCPCTFGLAVPLTSAVALAEGLDRGIVVTGVDVFDKSARHDVIAIDKTGTLSAAEMTVIEVIGPAHTAARAAAVERFSSHPVARAIARLESPLAASDANVYPGRGVTAHIAGEVVAVGSPVLFAVLGWTVPEALAARARAAAGDQVVSLVGWNGRAHGAVVTADRPRPEYRDVLEKLRRQSRVVLLTGAQSAGEYAAAVDDVYAGVPPEAKAAVVTGLRRSGTVTMVGDGSNDAPALAAADLGIAFGSPAALAAEAADVVIVGGRLERVPEVFAMIDTVRRRVRQNIGWALCYNALAIPLAAGGLLSPLAAALAMSLSSLLVVGNSVRPFGLAQGQAHARPRGVNRTLTAIRRQRDGCLRWRRATP